MSEEIQKDFVLDSNIPNPENWKRYNLETIKEMLCDWLDWNMEQQFESHPDIFMKEEEKRLYIHINEVGSRDTQNDGDEYYMLVESFDVTQIENN